MFKYTFDSDSQSVEGENPLLDSPRRRGCVAHNMCRIAPGECYCFSVIGWFMNLIWFLLSPAYYWSNCAYHSIGFLVAHQRYTEQRCSQQRSFWWRPWPQAQALTVRRGETLCLPLSYDGLFEPPLWLVCCPQGHVFERGSTSWLLHPGTAQNIWKTLGHVDHSISCLFPNSVWHFFACRCCCFQRKYGAFVVWNIWSGRFCCRWTKACLFVWVHAGTLCCLKLCCLFEKAKKCTTHSFSQRNCFGLTSEPSSLVSYHFPPGIWEVCPLHRFPQWFGCPQKRSFCACSSPSS